MPDWLWRLASGGAGGLLALLGTEFIKRAIGYRYAKKLEEVRSGLAADIEKMKIRLDRADFEHRTRFTRFHERQIDVVCTLYSKLVEVQFACEAITRPDRSDEPPVVKQLTAEFNKTFFEFRRFYELNLLFLDRPVCNDIAAFNQKAINAVVKITSYSGPDMRRDPHVQADKTRSWIEAFDIVKRDMPPIRQAIDAQFIRLLGVDQVEPEGDNAKTRS